MTVRLITFLAAVIVVISSCAPPPPIGKVTLSNYRMIANMRAERFESAAYLIDLRVDDGEEKFSVTTELYFSGDSVGLYGRGYLGKGTFKGHIIDDIVMVYFSSSNEYFSSPLSDSESTATECAAPGEVLLSILSLLAGREAIGEDDHIVYPSKRDVRFKTGRFDRTVRVNSKGFPETEKFIDPACGDSIVINYYMHSRKYPFYQPTDLLYYSTRHDFRARGFIREQKYNISIPEKKFDVRVPSDAARLESL